MFSIDQLSASDARQILDVLDWLQEHKAQLARKAGQISQEVSADFVRPTFHTQFTGLNCTRLLPITVKVFTDEDALEQGTRTSPNVLLERADDARAYMVPELGNNVDDFFEICRFVGVHPRDKIWSTKGS